MQFYPLPKIRSAALAVMAQTQTIQLFQIWLELPIVDIRTHFEAFLTLYSRYALGFDYN
jgi:hypothetical protein